MSRASEVQDIEWPVSSVLDTVEIRTGIPERNRVEVRDEKCDETGDDKKQRPAIGRVRKVSKISRSHAANCTTVPARSPPASSGGIPRVKRRFSRDEDPESP